MANMINLAVPGMMLLVGILVGMILSRAFGTSMEGFQTIDELSKKCGGSGGSGGSGGDPIPPTCSACFKQYPCGCAGSRPMCPPCPPCREPDLSKYVLKSTIPPCPSMPDLSKYMLKTECPPVPDLSNYVLKSSVPKPQPVLLDCSKCNKPSGECPPCPRPRCPEVKCPAPTKCPPPAPCPRQTCPPTVVKCKAEDAPVQQVRPYLAPLSVTGFGM